MFDKNGKWMGCGGKLEEKRFWSRLLNFEIRKPGKIKKVDIDTSYFNGNQPSQVSLQIVYQAEFTK